MNFDGLTPEDRARVEAIVARLAKATPGELVICDGSPETMHEGGYALMLVGENGDSNRIFLTFNYHFPYEADAEFHASAKHDTTDLLSLLSSTLAECRRVTEERDRLAEMQETKYVQSRLKQLGEAQDMERSLRLRLKAVEMERDRLVAGYGYIKTWAEAIEINHQEESIDVDADLKSATQIQDLIRQALAQSQGEGHNA